MKIKTAGSIICFFLSIPAILSATLSNEGGRPSSQSLAKRQSAPVGEVRYWADTKLGGKAFSVAADTHSADLVVNGAVPNRRSLESDVNVTAFQKIVEDTFSSSLNNIQKRDGKGKDLSAGEVIKKHLVAIIAAACVVGVIVVWAIIWTLIRQRNVRVYGTAKTAGGGGSSHNVPIELDRRTGNVLRRAEQPTSSRA